MELRTLGSTGIKVSRFALGTMHFGAWGNSDRDDVSKIVNAALDAGINLVDTADMYSDGGSEELVGAAIQHRRDEVVLATKGHFPMGGNPDSGGNSRRWLTRAVDDSLRRLQTDRIDLYQVHRPDPDTAIDETLSVLSDLVRAGKIMAIGCSDFPAEQIVESHWAAERGSYQPFRTEQPPYSIFVRGIERDVLPTAQRHGMGVLTWSPLNSGWLTGRYRSASDIDVSDFKALIAHKWDLALPGNQRKLDAVGQLLALADQTGVPLSHLALAFCAAHPAVSSVIIGPRTQEQLDDLLRAAELDLSTDVLDRIDATVPAGTNLNPGDTDWTPPALAAAVRRRVRAPLVTG